jgi:Fe-S-cluster containining protein
MRKGAVKSNACSDACKASCCRYVVSKIPAPRTKLDFDEIYWFLCHEGVIVFIESRKWYLMFEASCKSLDGRSLCRIYPKRPHVCREYSEEECEHKGDVGYEVFMSSPEDLKRYMKKRGITLRMAWMEADGGPGSPEKRGGGSRRKKAVTSARAGRHQV